MTDYLPLTYPLLDTVYRDYENDPALSDLKRRATQLVPGAGTICPLVVFIGEAPGRTEDAQGVPFVGAAGRKLDELLEVARLRRNHVFITNIVKYRPHVGGRNRPPSEKEVEASRPYLLRELEVLSGFRRPLVVPMGAHALSAFLPNESISAAHGHTFYFEGYILLPVYHPAVAIYNKALLPRMRQDFVMISDTLTEMYSDNKEHI